MTSRTGNRAARRSAEPRTGGFTLIELILVMAMLLVVLAVTGPSLSVFFRGRTLDSEARRFLTLTHYGQSRAVSEGVPMILWIDTQRGRYGLESEYLSTSMDTRSVDYPVSEDLQIEVEQGVAQTLTAVQSPFEPTAAMAAKNRMQIRFSPEGFVSETSPRRVRIRTVARNGGIAVREDVVWIGLTPNRLGYEIQNDQFPGVFR